MIEHNYVAHGREGWSVCTRCGMVRNYDRPIAGCRGVIGTIAVRGGMTMTTVEEETETPVCSVCARPTGFADEDKGEPPVNLARCPAPGGMECRAVAQAVAPWRRENETLRSNCDHLSSENASLASQVESMAMRIESLAEELAKPEEARLREVLDALEGRAVIFDGLGARVGHLIDEMDEWIERAGAAERRLKKAEEVVMLARQLTAYAWEDRLEDCKVSDEAKHDYWSVGERMDARGRVYYAAGPDREDREAAEADAEAASMIGAPPETLEPNLKQNEINIIKHALGWPKLYRNYYAAEPDSDACVALESMLERGLVRRIKMSSDYSLSLRVYVVTEAGAGAVVISEVRKND